MGSSGTNSFGDYKQSSTNKCDESIDSKLEDVARSEFYSSTTNLPAVNTSVRVREKLHHGRIVVEVIGSNLQIGNLPTKYHYLLLCIKNGRRYEGVVTASNRGKVPLIEVHLDSV